MLWIMIICCPPWLERVILELKLLELLGHLRSKVLLLLLAEAIFRRHFLLLQIYQDSTVCDWVARLEAALWSLRWLVTSTIVNVRII